ncbi:hypothetical protein DRQ25_15400 [Candidatus Fermentibacteria bacterium]|nr:MAG: hypothetical protein DRQ25_15400 [Candidatus Fermentibacteria bacterium]
MFNKDGSRKTAAILITGVLTGLLFGFLLPWGWLFMSPSAEHGHEGIDDLPESWACPMLCVVLDHPGTCPVCGMELEAFISTGDEIVLSRHDQAMLDLTIGEAAVRDLTTRFTAPGLIEFDGSGLYSVTAWTGGRIERLYVDYQGERISSGAAVADIYSPELYAAKQELLVLSQAESTLNGHGMILAAEKLRLLGTPEYVIRQIIDRGEVRDESTVISPASGTVTAINVREGEYVSTGHTLLELADIGTVWLTVYLTEDQSGLVDAGQELEFSIDSQPDKVFSATVDAVDPFLDQPGGASEARVILENTSGEFLPGQSAAATFINGEQPGTVLSVPRGSVLSLGLRSIVYVMTGPTIYEAGDDGSLRIEEARFEPREVTVGAHATDSRGEVFIPVYAGLSEGDIVALKGAFLIDSQAELLGLPSLFNGETAE